MKKFLPLILVIILTLYGIFSSLQKKLETFPNPIFNQNN